MTEREKTKCERLYEEYLELSKKTQLVAEQYTPGKPLKAQELNLENLLKKEALRIELLETCRPFLESELTSEELFELENG